MKKTLNLTKLNYPVSIPLLRDECLCMEQYSKPSLHKDHPTFQTVEHNVGWNVFRWNDIEFNSIRIPVNIQQVFDKLYSDLNIRHLIHLLVSITFPKVLTYLLIKTMGLSAVLIFCCLVMRKVL